MPVVLDDVSDAMPAVLDDVSDAMPAVLDDVSNVMPALLFSHFIKRTCFMASVMVKYYKSRILAGVQTIHFYLGNAE